jgi:predicted TIM-barrel fold metal-dependent hydrolase
VLARLPVDIVFDHMAVVKDNASLEDPGFSVLLDILDSGKGWVKLSNAFSSPDAKRAEALIRANPERVLWGSDWPHVGYRTEPPDDGKLVDQLYTWATTEAQAERILVDNPAQLYFR